MNKKLLRTVFAAFLSVFMFGTSINPAVFADGEDETVENNEGNEDAQEKGTDVRKTITAFVLGKLIPDEASDAEDLPDELPAKLEGEEDAKPTDVEVEWTEKEDAFTVDLKDDSYTLSDTAAGQLKGISVKKAETEEKEEVVPAEETGNDEPEAQPESEEDEKPAEILEEDLSGDTIEESKETSEDQLNVTPDAKNGTLANGNITGDDDLDESDSQLEAVNAKLVVGKGHEDFAKKLLKKLQGDTGYAFREQFSLSSDKTEINLVIPNNTKVGELQYDLDTDAGNCTVEPPMSPEEYLSYAIIAQKDSLDFYEDEFDDIRDSEAEMDNVNPIESGQTYYVLWKKPIEKINILVDTPICGTKVEYDEYERFPKEKSGQPIITVTDGTGIITVKKDIYGNKEEVFWVIEQPEYPYPVKFEGTITGGEQYIAEMEFDVSFKYYIKDGFTKILVNTEEPEQYEPSNTSLTIYKLLKAEHNWGDWEVTKEPAFTEKGEETRTCSGCGQTESREIDKVTYSIISGNGQTWTKGGNGTADFEFTRSYKDTAYDLFTEVQIDGKKVTDFTKAKGSVITKINASYMNTLSAGSHTITARFSDEGSVSASFTVEEDIKPEPEPKPEPDHGDDDDPDVKPKPSPAPDDGGKSSGGGSSNRQLTPVDNVVTCQMAGYPSNYSWNEAAKACQPGYLDAGGNFHPYKRSSVPNTGDMNLTIYAWIAMLAMTLAMYCGVKLLHEDWEV